MLLIIILILFILLNDIGDNMKKSRYATPIFIIGTYDKKGKPNAINATLREMSSSDPPRILVSIKETTDTHKNILNKGAFTVNIPSQTYIKEIGALRIECGKNEDKFTTTGLTPVKSELVDAPYIKEFPLALECKLIDTAELGLCTSFTGEVLDTKWMEI